MQDGPTTEPQTKVGLPLESTGKASATAPKPSRLVATFWRLKLWRLPLIMPILFTGAVIGLYFQPPALRAFFGTTGLQPGAGSSTPIAVAPIAPPTVVVEKAPTIAALGRLKPEGDSVTLALPFGAGDARVARLLVTEGDHVSAGQIIAELDSLPQLAAQLASAEATLAAREAAVAQTRSSVQASLTEAVANRDRAAAAHQLAASELARITDLAQRGVATGAQLEQAEAAATGAARELDRAAAALTRFTSEDGGIQADIVLAERNRDVAIADLNRAKQDMAKAQVVAATAGTILKLHVRAGEKPGQDGVATLGNTDLMMAELEVYQTDIRRIALGQPVTLSATALGSAPLIGTVARIGLEVERQSIFAADPAANTDARIVRIDVALDAASSARASNLTGLEVVGEITPAPEPAPESPPEPQPKPQP
ncbi:MAG: efflux RND transporter periplasmic adaptor subunit [Paracoccaceae bacterium]